MPAHVTSARAIEDGRITAIYITRNPDKLKRAAEALAIGGRAH